MLKYILLLVLIASPAFAQSEPTAIQQALAKKLMSEIDSGIVCSAQSIGNQKEIENLKAELKALRDKQEPAK